MDSVFRFMQRRSQAQFVNREEAIARFNYHFNRVHSFAEHQAQPAFILQFYGIGGIGKSRLISECRSALEHRYSNINISNLDFDDRSVVNPHRALLRLRNTAKGQKRIQFKTFDFAYAAYFAKRNPDFSFEKKKLPFHEEMDVIGHVVSAVGGPDVVGATKYILEKVQSYISNVSLPDEAKEALETLKGMSERDIEEALPDFLAYDLNLHSAENQETTIIFIDTYEALWGDHTSEKGRFSDDAWLRRLASGLKNALVVITGRERLLWPEYDPFWRRYVETYRLEKLSDKDVATYLRSAGLTEDTDFFSKISRMSDGHPYYLNLCIDTINQEGEVDTSNWPENRRSLFERFAKSLSSSELALLQRLAPLATYDEQYARAVVRHFNIAFNDDEIHAHYRFSFVKKLSNGAVLHDIMRRSLIAQMAPNSVLETRLFALRYYGERIHQLNETSTDDDIILPLLECARQLKHLNKPELANDWLNARGHIAISLLLKRAATSAVIEGLEIIRAIISIEDWPADIQTAYADATHLVGRYEDSVLMLERQLELAGTKAVTDPDFVFASVRRLHHSMMFRSIDDVWKETEATIAGIDPNSFPKAYGEALFLIGGNLGAARGIVDDAWPWLQKAINWAEDQNDNALRVRIYRKVSDIYRLSDNLQSSREAIEKGLELAKTKNLRRYLNYLQCTMIDQYRVEDNRSYGFSSIKTLRERLAQDNLDGWLGHSYLLESALYFDEGTLNAVNDTLDRALTSYNRTNHLWGLLQVELLKLRLQVKLKDTCDLASQENLKMRLRQAGFLRDANCIDALTKQPDMRVPSIAFL